MSVTKDGEKTFVTLQGKDLNSFGESNNKGTDGFKESILRSLYRSQRDKRGLICSDYPKILKECGGVVRKQEVVRKKPTVKTYEPKKVESESGKSQEVKKTFNKVSEGQNKPTTKRCVWKCVVEPCDDDMLPEGCVWDSD